MSRKIFNSMLTISRHESASVRRLPIGTNDSSFLRQLPSFPLGTPSSRLFRVHRHHRHRSATSSPEYKIDVEGGGDGNGHRIYFSPLDKKRRPSLINETDFEKVSALHEAFDQSREIVIKLSRDILKASKKAIYDLHRNEVDGAKEKMREADGVVKRLEPIFKESPRLLEENSYRGALEELVEAKCFAFYLETGKLIPYSDLNINDVFSVEEYIAGVCDFTGELGRHAVHCCIARRFDDVIAAYHILDQIHGQLLTVNVRNKSGSAGDLRLKFDQIKWTLKKVEQLVYDISSQGGHAVE